MRDSKVADSESDPSQIKSETQAAAQEGEKAAEAKDGNGKPSESADTFKSESQETPAESKDATPESGKDVPSESGSAPSSDPQRLSQHHVSKILDDFLEDTDSEPPVEE